MGKKLRTLLILAAVLVPLSGCLFSGTFDELYQLPQLPAEYTELQKLLDQIQDSGAEYAAPMSGANIQTVQLKDLDNDGEQEALAFFRQNGDERPLKIYIFRTVDGVYRQAAMIEGSGTAIYSVQYSDLDGDGLCEILVGWRISPELQALSVYTLREEEPLSLMTTNYVRYAAADLNEDGQQELTVLRGDGSGNNVADFYGWHEDGSLMLLSTTRLSMTMAELQEITEGTLEDGEPALFVTGVAEETKAITDILACREGRMTNLVVNPSTGVSGEIFRYVGLEPMDIDEDGVTEVPMPALLLSEDEEICWKIYWRRYNSDGSNKEACLTYHDLEQGWYLFLPQEWDNRISVRRSSQEGGQVTSFGYMDEDSFVEVLNIYAFTGSDRESQASRSDRIILVRQPGSVIYAASITEEGAAWKYAIDEEELRASFRVIPAEWGAGNQ